MPQQPQLTIPPDVHSFFSDVFQQTGIQLSLPEQLALYSDVAMEVGYTAEQIWTPIEPHLEMARSTTAYELYFGGRAGCGKSLLGAGIACTEHTESIFFRPQYTQLKDIIKKTRKMLAGTGASFNGSDYIWSNIPGGRTLEFGACNTEDDVEKFRGREHDLIVFDEIGTFREEVYLQLSGWLRTADPNQRCRIIATGNPPLSSDYYWVKQRWAAWVDDKHENPAKPGEIRWYVNMDGEDTEVPDDTPILHRGETLYPLSRTFVPGKLLDILKNTGYVATLQRLREPLRSQLLHGDFSMADDDKELQVIRTEWVRAAQARWKPEKPKDVPLRGTGVDVSRGGKDQTIVSKRYGMWFAPLKKYDASESKTGDAVAALVINNLESDEHKKLIVLDLTGIGSSPFDSLVSQGFNVDGFLGASKSYFTDASGTLNFANRRAEAWWKFAEALDPNSGEEIALPPDSELMADLTAPTWKLTGRGIQIEDKEEIKKRIGRSPDCGDAVVMNFNIDTRSAESVAYF